MNYFFFVQFISLFSWAENNPSITDNSIIALINLLK